MQCCRVIHLIEAKLPILRTNYNVKHIALFGSVARNEANPNSDIDILVEFKDKANFDNFMNLKFFLEDILHSPVDLVTIDALKPRLKSFIEKELINVA